MNSPGFDLYLGIDWSGAVGPRLPGLRVACCKPGACPPLPIDNPAGGHWTRRALFDWLEALIGGGRRVLAGFDFAPALPCLDRDGYFPGLDRQPAAAPALWALVDEVCAGSGEFYGAGFYHRRDLPYHRYFLSPRGRGDRYAYRQRRTERACAAVTAPHPVFKCIGPANVGTGSLAGMRFFHHFLHRNRSRAAVWPFEPIGSRSALVEIFPRFCFVQAGADPRRWRERAVIDRALAAHASDPMPESVEPKREDEADAMVTAAALRAFAAKPESWQPPGMDTAAAASEGWIFGVCQGSKPG